MYGCLYLAGKGYDLATRGSAMIHKDEGLTVVNTHSPLAVALQPCAVYEPACGELHITLASGRVVRHLWKLG